MTAIPTVHLNGTSKGDLLEGYLEQFHAIKWAIAVLAKHPPNGRDYYPQGAGALHTAISEHHSRLQRLQDIEKELETIMEGIA